MERVSTIKEWREWRRDNVGQGELALVPTMGALHAGHLSLMRAARRAVGEDGKVVLWVFVNPAQFDRSEDLDAYPRNMELDCRLAKKQGVDCVFSPAHAEEIFPVSGRTWVEVAELDKRLCGATRPGHFRGVCTVVNKLWGLVQPDVTFFGEKDFQQLAIIRRMHADLFLSGRIVGVPIVREVDGLAMSSRNARLSASARRQATCISEYLQSVRGRFEDGQRNANCLLADAKQAIEPGRLEYAELLDAELLTEISTVERPVVVAVAAYFEGVRLIDNLVLPG